MKKIFKFYSIGLFLVLMPYLSFAEVEGGCTIYIRYKINGVAVSGNSFIMKGGDSLTATLDMALPHCDEWFRVTWEKDGDTILIDTQENSRLTASYTTYSEGTYKVRAPFGH